MYFMRECVPRLRLDSNQEQETRVLQAADVDRSFGFEPALHRIKSPPDEIVLPTKPHAESRPQRGRQIDNIHPSKSPGIPPEEPDPSAVETKGQASDRISTSLVHDLHPAASAHGDNFRVLSKRAGRFLRTHDGGERKYSFFVGPSTVRLM